MIATSTIQTIPLPWDSVGPVRWTHLALVWGLEVDVSRLCDKAHESPIDWMDCPVASRWCLMRSRSIDVLSTQLPKGGAAI